MIKLGFLGGGIDSIAGRTHIIASQMDLKFKVIGGIFSSCTNKSIQSALEYGVKHFNSIDALINQIDVIVVLLPTPQHFQILKMLFKYNIPIICEKPLVSSMKEILYLEALYKDRFLAVINNYSGYPMLREFRESIKNGDLGIIKNIIINMPQESFLRPPKNINYPQKWRMKDHEIPTICLDLGVHIHYLSYFLLEEEPIKIFGEYNNLSCYNVIDDVKISVKYKNDKIGSFNFSKVQLGNANSLSIEVYGTTGSAKWEQNNNETLIISDNDGCKKILNRGSNLLLTNQKRYNRMTIGHPSGFIEAFANIYYDIAEKYYNKESNYVFGITQAKLGLQLFTAATESNEEGKWCDIINNNKLREF